MRYKPIAYKPNLCPRCASYNRCRESCIKNGEITAITKRKQAKTCQYFTERKKPTDKTYRYMLPNGRKFKPSAVKLVKDTIKATKSKDPTVISLALGDKAESYTRIVHGKIEKDINRGYWLLESKGIKKYQDIVDILKVIG